MRLSILLVLLCMYTGQLQAKIRILTFHYNNADFIEMQDLTLRKFMQDEYELIVFNDASSLENEGAIAQTCENLGIPCIRFEQSWHLSDPLNLHLQEQLLKPGVKSHIGFNYATIECIGSQASVRHCHVIQYALDNYGYDHDDLVVLFDGDIFPIRPIYLRSLMENSQMMGNYKYIHEQDVGYFWVPFICMDMPRMPYKQDLKFHVDLVKDYIFDTGAHSYHYLQNNPGVITKKHAWFSSSTHHYQSILELIKMGFGYYEAKFIQDLPWPLCVEFQIDKHFLHFGAGSFCLSGSDLKWIHVKEFLNKICQ
jgi:hypothetical protein